MKDILKLIDKLENYIYDAEVSNYKDSNFKIGGKGKIKVAEKITDHFFEFIEWKDNFTEFDIDEQLYKAEIETHIIDWMPLDHLYGFWLTNIKK
jgi:hypothetical protein